MDGDQDGAQDQSASQPESRSVEAPNTRTHGGITDSQPSISEQAFVDRINRSDRWMIILTATIALSGVISAIIFAKQLIVMSSQVEEMRTTRIGGDKSMTDQMAVMRDQAKAMQGQLDQMALAQRAWVLVDNLSVEQIQVFPVGAGIDVSTRYRITNLGHSPATEVLIRTTLVLRGVDVFDERTVPSICKQQPAVGDDASMFQGHFSRTILPAQSETISGFLSDAASFRHTVVGLKEETVSGQQVFFADMLLVGCVTYKISGDAGLHETGFAFNVGAFLGDVPFQRAIFPQMAMPIPIDTRESGVVKTGILQVVHSPVGNFAN